MKKLYKVIAILAIVAFVFGFKYISDARTNPINESVNYETELFNAASLYELYTNESMEIKNISTIPVDDFTAEFYGYDYCYNIEYTNSDFEDMSFPGLPSNPSTQKYDLTDLEHLKISSAQNKKIESAKKRICKFIDDFSFFTDKEFLKKCINDIKFVLTENHNLFKIPDSQYEFVAIFYEGTVYINKNEQRYFFEHTAVHELMHGLRHLTHFGNTNWELDVQYAGLPFDEGMTEILSYSTGAYLPNNINGYNHYIPNLYRYIQIYKEDALKAYFYGYDEFFAKYGETFQLEHEAFSASFTGYNTEFADLMNQISMEILNKMIQNSDK